MEINKVVSDYNVKLLNRVARRKAAAEKAENANQEADPENGEQAGGNMVPMGGKPANTAGRSMAFGGMTLNDMDLQNGSKNVALESKNAKRVSVMKGATTSDGGENVKMKFKQT